MLQLSSSELMCAWIGCEPVKHLDDVAPITESIEALDESQLCAVKFANKHNLCILDGPAGTGAFSNLICCLVIGLVDTR